MHTQAVAAKAALNGIWTDVLVRVSHGIVHSAQPNDTADVYTQWPDKTRRCVTFWIRMLAEIGYVRRAPGRTGWELTDTGREVLDAELDAAGGAS
jgi:hypothetical protein